jgi:hypothetical protein
MLINSYSKLQRQMREYFGGAPEPPPLIPSANSFGMISAV